MPQRTTIIWDWNGTLLDDAEICREAINKMLKVRNLPELSLSTYRDVFTFPVIEYYKEVGFNFDNEEWEPVAMEFINLYLGALPSCGLTPFAARTLEIFKRKGYRQAIISAMQHDALLKSVSALGIFEYFDYIGGIGDHYGGGKIDNARNYFIQAGLSPEKITLIGDTLHDSEVAAELQCKCILVATGHQSFQRLSDTGLQVINNLSEIDSGL
ncbi:MAG: HAD hydrolase-like protein [Bacteroidales bacterium]|nr:HAD hydrolase-like protein [Bacteroidales bacterium]